MFLRESGRHYLSLKAVGVQLGERRFGRGQVARLGRRVDEAVESPRVGREALRGGSFRTCAGSLSTST